MVLLTLGAALAATGHQTTVGVSDDELGVRALQAAEAGAQAAVHRMNLQQPADDRCITTSVASPQTGNAWCAQTGAESVGNNASFAYQTSLPVTTGCTGSDFGSSLLQRCIVATGTAGGVTKRVIQRVVSSTGVDPFPVDGIVGKDFITMGNNNTVAGAVGTNGQLELGNNSSISGGVQLWRNAPAPIGYSGTVQRNANPFVLSPPNMLNPSTLLDSKTSNDNARLLAGANPADSCSTGSGACYNASTRTLTLGNNDSVTLGGAVYNFCQINLGNNSSINVAAGAKVLIYLDSPGRSSGSGCAAGSGGMSTGNGATCPTRPRTRARFRSSSSARHRRGRRSSCRTTSPSTARSTRRTPGSSSRTTAPSWAASRRRASSSRTTPSRGTRASGTSTSRRRSSTTAAPGASATRASRAPRRRRRAACDQPGSRWLTLSTGRRGRPARSTRASTCAGVEDEQLGVARLGARRDLVPGRRAWRRSAARARAASRR